MVGRPGFAFARTPKIIFGPGRSQDLGSLASAFGKTVLLVTGGSSLSSLGRKAQMEKSFQAHSLRCLEFRVSHEPTPACVDQAVADFAAQHIDVVVAVGGGSALDTGKAVAAMLPLGGRVADYLEGVGFKTHPGCKLPMIAVPTTAGTGTEATKNASLRQAGENGFKNSLRHENFVPDAAVIDPELALTCPRQVTAACGMDALAQLLESYVSPQASPLTDALAWSGLAHIKDNLAAACGPGSQSVEVRGAMAYAALLSGLALANAGLGIVHSLSSVLGGFFDIPHGVICGTLLAAGMKINVRKLLELEGMDSPAVVKHAQAGELLKGQAAADNAQACQWLVERLEAWAQELDMPRLGAYGVTAGHVDKILPKAALRNNPVQLSKDEIAEILLERI